jgi:hypothetical protein
MADIIDTVLEGKTAEELATSTTNEAPKLPILTEVVVNQAIELLKEVEKNGGYGDIAKTIGWDKIRKSQVKQIHLDMIKKLAELQTNPL